MHDVGAGDEHGLGDALAVDDVGSAKDRVLLAFGEDHAPRVLLREPRHVPHHAPRRAELADESVTIVAQVEVFLGDAAPHRGFGDGGRDPAQRALVHGLGDDVLGPVLDRLVAVRDEHVVADALSRESGERVGGGELHLLVDVRSGHVEGAAEEVGEPQDVVHLVGEVGPAGADDRVGTRRARLLVADLRVGVGEREDDGFVGHRLQHLGGHDVPGGEADEHVGVHDHVCQRLALVGDRSREGRAIRVEVRAVVVDHAVHVEERDVLGLHAHLGPQTHAADGRGAGADAGDAHRRQVFALQLGGVAHGGSGDDGGAVLIVVEDRDLHARFERLFDREALGSLDVLEVDASKGGLERGDHIDEALRIAGVDLDVEHVDVRVLLEEDRLALHHRLGGQGTDVAQAEHRAPVGDHAHEVPAGGVEADGGRIAGDLAARSRHAGRVGQAELALGRHRLRRHHLDLSWPAFAMILERVFFQSHREGLYLSRGGP